MQSDVIYVPESRDIKQSVSANCWKFDIAGGVLWESQWNQREEDHLMFMMSEMAEENERLWTLTLVDMNRTEWHCPSMMIEKWKRTSWRRTCYIKDRQRMKSGITGYVHHIFGERKPWGLVYFKSVIFICKSVYYTFPFKVCILTFSRSVILEKVSD